MRAESNRVYVCVSVFVWSIYEQMINVKCVCSIGLTKLKKMTMYVSAQTMKILAQAVCE